MRHFTLSVVLGAAFLAGPGCSRQPSVEEQAEAASGGPGGAVESVFVAEPPPAAVSIPEARKTVSPGSPVTVKAKVMGTVHPFVEGRAVMVVGDDATLTSCDEQPGDSCETPWDCCCDTPEVLRAGIATVQVVDAEGGVLREGLKGVRGLRELSEVVVAGTVADGSTADSLVINASSIYVGP